jgi:hypothetical protein
MPMHQLSQYVFLNRDGLPDEVFIRNENSFTSAAPAEEATGRMMLRTVMEQA